MQICLAVLSLISEAMISLLLVSYLFLLDPLSMFAVIFLVGGGTFVYFSFVRKRIGKYGEDFQRSSGLLLKSINQSLGGIKELKITHKENFFVDIYGEIGKDYVKSVRISNIMNIFPKYSLEVLCIFIMMLVVIIKLFLGYEVLSIVPQLTAFAVAAIRLLPAVNRISTYINSIIYYKPSIDLIYQDIKETEDEDNIIQDESNWNELTENATNLYLQKIKFKYSMLDNYILNEVSINFPLGKSI
jgi:ABC-type multidrug transport system fused ATPase/permease subunit